MSVVSNRTALGADCSDLSFSAVSNAFYLIAACTGWRSLIMAAACFIMIF